MGVNIENSVLRNEWGLLKLAVISWLSFFSFIGGAQPVYEPVQDIVFEQVGDTLQFPMTGGFNNPQFSSTDLNGDLVPDLFIFDRGGNKVITFIGNAGGGYEYDPSFENDFPPLENWALLVDYNCDGVKDIFTSTVNKVTLYRGENNGGNITYTKVIDTLRYKVNSLVKDMFVNQIDIPAIIDVNNDGDLDILTFAAPGGFMEYFENQTIEDNGNCDTIILELTDFCWGRFYESGLTRTVDLDTCQAGGGFTNGQPDHERHAGSTCLALDLDGDGLKEMLLGDVWFSNLVGLYNNGTLDSAHIYAQDTAFPANTQPAEMEVFPAGFYEDVDGDSLKDLLVTPNSKNASVSIDNIWYYKNTGSASNVIFTFQERDFLAGQTVDVGSISHPVFFDYNADGLTDLLIGNRDKKAPTFTQFSGLTLFKNIGSASKAEFKWISDDYSSLQGFLLNSIRPTFGDTDDDGDLDMIIGEEDGKIHFFENTGGAGNPANFPLISPVYFGIDVGSASTPQLIDINRDGLLDLVIGEKNGNLNYFENSGTKAAPNFSSTPDNAFFGEVDVRFVNATFGYSVPLFLDIDGSGDYELLVGTHSGRISYYTDIEQHLNDSFPLVTDNFNGIDAGERSSVHAAKLSSNSLQELGMGNLRGGLNIYENPEPVGNQPIEIDGSGLKLYPNPAMDWVNVKINGEQSEPGLQLMIYNILGNLVIRKSANGEGRWIINVSDLPAGVYIAAVENTKTQIARAKFTIYR